MFDTIHEAGVSSNLDDTLKNLNPRYEEKIFLKPRTIFCVGDTKLRYIHSERNMRGNYDRSERAKDATNKKGFDRHTARWFQEYLCAYYDKPVTLCYMASGLNAISGYPYYVWGIKR